MRHCEDVSASLDLDDDRYIISGCAVPSISEVVSAEISVASPQKMLYFVNIQDICRIKVSKKTFNLILDKAPLRAVTAGLLAYLFYCRLSNGNDEEVHRH